MSEMVERVARALHASLGYEAKWPEPECSQCIDAARAAIAAMREPTMEVANAWCAVTNEEYAKFIIAMQAWYRGIDAALSEEKQPA